MKGLAGHTTRPSVARDKLIDKVARTAAQAAREEYQSIVDDLSAEVIELRAQLEEKS